MEACLPKQVLADHVHPESTAAQVVGEEGGLLERALAENFHYSHPAAQVEDEGAVPQENVSSAHLPYSHQILELLVADVDADLPQHVQFAHFHWWRRMVQVADGEDFELLAVPAAVEALAVFETHGHLASLMEQTAQPVELAAVRAKL